MSLSFRRIQIRFRKTGDLRWISHRDLARAFERLFRRANLKLRMSEGFHPHPKINFASALALGLEGTNELVDVDVVELSDCEELRDQFAALAPEGLVIDDVREIQAEGAKTRTESFVYEVDVPDPHRLGTKTKISELLATSSYPIERPGRKQPIDLREGIRDLSLEEGILRMTIAESKNANVRPREVLEALGLENLEKEGCKITRTAIRTAPLESLDRNNQESK